MCAVGSIRCWRYATCGQMPLVRSSPLPTGPRHRHPDAFGPTTGTIPRHRTASALSSVLRRTATAHPAHAPRIPAGTARPNPGRLQRTRAPTSTGQLIAWHRWGLGRHRRRPPWRSTDDHVGVVGAPPGSWRTSGRPLHPHSPRPTDLGERRQSPARGASAHQRSGVLRGMPLASACRPWATSFVGVRNAVGSQADHPHAAPSTAPFPAVDPSAPMNGFQAGRSLLSSPPAEEPAW